ncbi:MAG: hypothetical protein KAQ98_09550 [Bacteriovoracaceae bacterium]|nr:hypothetical protein [Bacteriovoracaceae bacterium]
MPHIRFSEIAKHPLLGKKPIVRGKFQAATGSTFSIEEYDAILELMKSKDFDVDILPMPSRIEKALTLELNNERDVEIMLLEPLLEKLGFTENDWIRQFVVRMGRGQRNYPDYVLGGNPKHGEETAVALVECKYHIDRQATLIDAFRQAKSYALRLQSELFVLADKQGVWIFLKRKNEFSCDNYHYKNWTELSNPDVLHELSLVIGKRVINNLISKSKSKSKSKRDKVMHK